ncbi:two-component sensor histidine kinase [Bifidobacterium sp. MA2]|uniref:Two-component sensor histidine kinase n=1 Tax=Bifidobacterium santillanense TaxID=2809028 RepID=A0ABS5ULT1_9BIFI|nr:histidine kinase [Bifidobacterium santillanense]MBT1171867.1 two-component sensor histidine kinase [Bifidobacterium santillanense]
MRELAVKTLLFALCLALSAPVLDAFSPWTVAGDAPMTAGMLLAVCATASAGWLRSPGLGSGAAAGAGWVPPAAYVAMALFEPRWCLFLPTVAYDAARVHPDGMRPVLRLVVRFAWIVPLLRCALPYLPYLRGVEGPEASVAPSLLLTAALCAGLGFALGRSDDVAAASRRALRMERDRARESARGARTRIADMDEERSRAVRIATLGERTRIAREIHDNVGHLLTRAIMQAKAGGVVADATGDAVASRGFAELGGTLDDAMTMVRRSVHDLEDDGTDFAAQIDAAAHAFDGGSSGLDVALTRDVASAPAPVARCLATVIRESLSNVARHSGARSATVTLRDFPAIWQLVVLDPGPRLDEDEEAARAEGEAPRGMGLADIAERVRAVGGTSVCGPYGDGWRVFVAVPKGPWSTTRQPDTRPRPVSPGRNDAGIMKPNGGA